MYTRLTNKKLSALLTELGFKPGEPIRRKRRPWRHSESGCELFLPVNKLDEAPLPVDIVGIRAQLSLQGHLDEDDFDYFAIEGKLPTRSSP
jgi:hypothetical protein